MNHQLSPCIGDFVLHYTGIYHGKVIGYGEQCRDTGNQLTLKVGMPSSLVDSRVIVIEDLASHWLRRTESDLQVLNGRSD